MIPADIQKKLITLPAAQKVQVVDMCIKRLIEMNGKGLGRPVPFSINNLKFIKKELQSINSSPLTAPGLQVANFVITGEQQREIIWKVYQFACRLRAIVSAKVYEKLSNAGAANSEFQETELLASELIAFVAEVTAAIDLKIAHHANKNFSLRRHNRTFEQQASDFIKQVMKENPVNADPACGIPISLQPQIKRSGQENNKNSVAALIANFSNMLNKQSVPNLRPINRESVFTKITNDLPRVKLTIR